MAFPEDLAMMAAILAVCVNFTAGVYDVQDDFSELVTCLKDEASSSCDTMGMVTQVLVREIEQRVKLQADFERKIALLESENRRGIGQPHRDPVVAFSARMAYHMRSLTYRQKMKFSEVITNLGNAYHPDTSEFRCPVTGLYHFEVTMLVFRGERIHVELMAAGQPAMVIYAGAVKFLGSGSNTVLLKLNKDDMVYVRLHGNTGSNVQRRWSTFGGHLVRQIFEEQEHPMT